MVKKTDSSVNPSRTEEKNSLADMVSILQGLQSSLQQLVEVSKAQTEAFNSFREDILLQPDPDEEIEEDALDKMSNSLDFTAATNQLLDSSNSQSPKPTQSDSGSKNNILDSLT